MKIEKDIMYLLKKRYPRRKIMGVRFLNKAGENLWYFRFTFKKGNYLSISEEMVAFFSGIKLKITHKFTSPGISVLEHDDSSKKKVKHKTI